MFCPPPLYQVAHRQETYFLGCGGTGGVVYAIAGNDDYLDASACAEGAGPQSVAGPRRSGGGCTHLSPTCAQIRAKARTHARMHTHILSYSQYTVYLSSYKCIYILIYKSINVVITYAYMDLQE